MPINLAKQIFCLHIIVWAIFFRCLGPDIGDLRRTAEGKNGLTPGTTLPAPVMVYPPVGYQTTSNILLLKTNSESNAVSYLFEALSGSTLLTTQTLTAPVVEGLLTIPAASYGTVTIRLSYLNSAGVRSPVISNNITYLDFSAGTLVKTVDFTTKSTCSSCALFFFAPCSPYSYNPLWPPIPPASNCPAFPNDDWTHCQTDSFVAEGNAWICAAAPEASMLANHNVLNTYHPANTGFEYNWLDISMNSSSYQMGHTAAATNEALIISCRMRKAAECGVGGKDTGVSFWYYPYRDANTTDNVQIASRDCSGNWTTLLTARVTAINQLGQAYTNKLNSRIDCLGDYFTAYYKSGSDYVPIAIAKDNIKNTGRTGWGFGPGHPTAAILHRVASFEWRHW